MTHNNSAVPPWLNSKYRIKRNLRNLFNRRVPVWVNGPEVLQIETQNRCNLKCNYCNVECYHKGDIGEMPLQNFINVLDDAKQLKTVEKVHLFLNGEYLLEKRAHLLTKLTKKKLGCQIATYTNGTLFNNRELLRDKNLDEIHFTISAATQETYKTVHGKNLFDSAIKTVMWFDKNRFSNQIIIIRFVMTAENMNELDAWKKLFSKYYRIVSPLHVNDKQETSKNKICELDKETAKQKGSFKGWTRKDMLCPLWNSISISWRGDILQCSTVPYSFNWGKIGETTLKEAWKKRLSNALNNPVCDSCNQRHPKYKERFKRFYEVIDV